MLQRNWILKELQKINLIHDEAEKSLRYQQIYAIIEKVDDYNNYIFNYEYEQKRQKIINRGVLFIPLVNHSGIKSNWSKIFAASVSSKEKKEIYYDSYRWHIFSFEKVLALTGTKARQAFNKCKKEKVFIFYQHKKEAYQIDHANFLKSSDFDDDYDIYLFDAVNQWTYVHTHEMQCGPYFYQIKQARSRNKNSG